MRPVPPDEGALRARPGPPLNGPPPQIPPRSEDRPLSIPPLGPAPGPESLPIPPSLDPLDPLLRLDPALGLSAHQLDSWFGHERETVPACERRPDRAELPTPYQVAIPLQASDERGQTAIREAVAPADLPPGNLEQIDHRYEIVGTLGAGGISRIYRVRHRGMGKDFALKIINDTYADDARVREIFAREAHVLSRLNHPNIVQITDFGFDARHGAFLVMELVEGITLREELYNHGRIRIRRATDLVLQIAEALDYIHNVGVVHCDVKADNVLLVQTGRYRRRTTVKLIDFGLSRTKCLGALVSSGGVGGTPHYMAPEQIRGAPPAPAMDVYALGVLFFELLTGDLPFTGSAAEVMRAHVSQDPPTLASRLEERVPEELEALIAKSLRKDPARRHATIGHFIYALRSVAEMHGFLPSQSSAEVTDPGQEAASPPGECFCGRLPHPGFVLRGDGIIVAANPAFGMFVHADPTALRGTSIGGTLLGRAFPGLVPDLGAALSTGQPLQRLLSFDGPGGSAITVLLTVMPITADPGDPARYLGLVVPLLAGTITPG